MSQQDVYAVIGRAKSDEVFLNSLFDDFGAALKEGGYTLTPEEIERVKSKISDAGGGPSAPTRPSFIPLEEITNSFKQQQEETWRRIKAQNTRIIDLNQFTADTLKQTIGHSAATYRKVTMMNQVMFWMGVGLFLFAVAYGAIFRDLKYSGAFAGLGTVSFIGFFFLGPIQKTQVALSNLIQAEIAFMTYFEQMSLVEGFASLPRDNAPGLLDPARIERASELLQLRAEQTIVLLQRYLEDEPAKAQQASSRRAKKQATTP